MLKINGKTVTPNKSALPAAVVARMASMGQRKAISTVGMKKGR